MNLTRWAACLFLLGEAVVNAAPKRPNVLLMPGAVVWGPPRAEHQKAGLAVYGIAVQ